MTERNLVVLRSFYCDLPGIQRFKGTLSPDHFARRVRKQPCTSGERMAFEVLYDHNREYGRMPSYEEAVISIKDLRGYTQDAFEAGMKLLLQCEEEKDARPDDRWLEKETHRFIIGAVCADEIMGVIEDINPSSDQYTENRKKNPEEDDSDAWLRHTRRILDVREMLSEVPFAGLGLDDPDYIHDKLNSREQRFLTGLPSIDTMTDGGLGRNQVGVVQAGSGVGKSMTLCHLAAEAVRQGAGVLYINLESDAHLLQARIINNLANIHSRQYKELSAEQRRAVHEPIRHLRCHVKDLLASAKPSDMAAAMEEFRYKHQKYPDVIILDYLNEAEVENPGKNNTSYSDVGGNLKALMKMAKRTNSALWTAVQINREGLKKSRAGGKARPDDTDMADSIAPLYKATLVFTLHLVRQRNHTSGVGYLRLSVNKFRHNADQPEVLLRLDYPFARLTELNERQVAEVMANSTEVATAADSPWAFNQERGERERAAAAGKMPQAWIDKRYPDKPNTSGLKV